MKKYLIRLDDACPTMDRTKWSDIINFLCTLGISPLVGVIPDCLDKEQEFMPKEDDSSFWNRMNRWQNKGCTMAMHGFNHTYSTCTNSLNPVNPQSEFAGQSYDKQSKMLRDGYLKLIHANLSIDWFFAPSHTFDENTLLALKSETPIRKISDTIALKPYYAHGLIFCPVQSGHFFTPPISGVWTFCFHPSIMSEKEIEDFKTFILENTSKFDSFNNIVEVQEKKNIKDILLSKSYFSFRKIRKLMKKMRS